MSGCSKLPFTVLGTYLTMDMVIPIVTQPASVLLLRPYAQDSYIIVGSVIAILNLAVMGLTRKESNCYLYYYWIASSVTYVVVVFEVAVLPLSEIDGEENFLLVSFSALALLFLYLTRMASEDWMRRGRVSEVETHSSETCEICWFKVAPRSRHCRVCQTCVPRYDYHCYWLNSCIGEGNQPFFVVGLFFGVLSLGYASLLILTTVCEPQFVHGILLPEDCRDITFGVGSFTCFFCGLYCMELAILLLAQLVQQMWLISRGYSAWEWREDFKRGFIGPSPHSRGFVENWIQFFKDLKKISRSWV